MKLALSRKNVWERTPRPLRVALGTVLARVVPPQYLLGRRFRETLDFVHEAQRWSAQQVRAYQIEQLRMVCGIAYELTAYYRDAFDRAGLRPGNIDSADDLRVLGTIDKDVVRDNVERMCAVSTSAANVDYVSTGGSTGAPLRFYIGAGRSAIEYAYLVACWQRAGYRLDLPLCVFRGQIVQRDRSGFYHEYDSLLRRHYYSNFHMTDATIGRYLDHIATIGPCYLLGYPSSMVALARFMDRSGTSAPKNVCGILAGSEIVYPEDRQRIEASFGVRCCSWYGHTEKLVLAAECEYSTDYHVWPTYGYFELLDETGNAVTTPGQRGEIVGTGFINTVMPFIRYRTGDFATYVGDRCEACGREHTIIRDIRGHRTQEMLVASDGSLISWTALNMHDDTFDAVRQFQFAQTTPGQATLKIVPADGFGERNMERIQRNMGRKLDGRLTFDIQCVDSIPLTPSGKTTYVEQRLDIDSIAAAGAGV